MLEKGEAAYDVLKNKVTDKLRSEGYTVRPFIKNPGLVMEVGSDNSEKHCVFVVLGQDDLKQWENEQEICYMLSRLDPNRIHFGDSNRSWKSIWLFDAILRPDECLKEMKEFLKKNSVKPKPAANLEGSSLSKRPAVLVRLGSYVKRILYTHIPTQSR